MGGSYVTNYDDGDETYLMRDVLCDWKNIL